VRDGRLGQHLDHRPHIPTIGSPSDVFLKGSEIIPMFENQDLAKGLITSNDFDIPETGSARRVLDKHGQLVAKPLRAFWLSRKQHAGGNSVSVYLHPLSYGS